MVYTNGTISASPIGDGQFYAVYLSFEGAPNAVEIARFPAGTFEAGVAEAQQRHADAQQAQQINPPQQ